MKKLLFLIVAMVMASCAAVGTLLPSKVSQSREQLESVINSHVVGTWRVNELVNLRVLGVKLTLLPTAQRFALDVPVVLDESLFGKQWQGLVKLEAGIRIDPLKGQFMLVKPTLENLEVEGLARPLAAAARVVATQTLLPRLDGLAVYNLNPQIVKGLAQLSIQAGALTIEAEQITLHLVSKF